METFEGTCNWIVKERDGQADALKSPQHMQKLMEEKEKKLQEAKSDCTRLSMDLEYVRATRAEELKKSQTDC